MPGYEKPEIVPIYGVDTEGRPIDGPRPMGVTAVVGPVALAVAGVAAGVAAGAVVYLAAAVETYLYVPDGE